MSEEENPLLVDYPEPGICRLTLNRPDKLNAFTHPLFEALYDELERVRYDPDVRVVIITGAGRAFCAGADLRGMGKEKEVREDLGKPQGHRYSMMRLARLPVAIRSLPQPVICAVNGAAAGAGFAMAVASDITLMAQSAKFVNAIHNAGSGTEFGMSYMLPRVIGTQRAAEILYTTRPVKAAEAAEIGLVLKTVPDEKLMDEALTVARSIAANVPLGVWLTKQALWANQSAGSLETAMDYEHRGVFIAQSSEDAKEKRSSFIEKRTPKFTNR